MKFVKFINSLLFLVNLSMISSTKRRKLKIDTLLMAKKNVESNDEIFDNSHYLSHILAYDEKNTDTFIHPKNNKPIKIIDKVIDIRSNVNACTNYKGRVLVGQSIKSPNTLVIIFRGTDSICNVAEDLRISQVSLTNKSYKSYKEAKIHEGFMNVYRSLRYELRKTIFDILTKNKNYNTIFITGHSLGGALANLCTVDMNFYYNEGDGKNIVSNGLEFNLVTFGSPRVGDHTFANYINGIPRMKRNIRVIYQDDIIAQIPVTEDYVHAGTSMTIKEGFPIGDFNKDTTPRLQIAKDIFNPEGISAYASNIISLIDCNTSAWKAFLMMQSAYLKVKNISTYDVISLMSYAYENFPNKAQQSISSEMVKMGNNHTEYKDNIYPFTMLQLRNLYDELSKVTHKNLKKRFLKKFK